MLTEKKHKDFRSILRVAKVYVQKVPFLAIFNGERGKREKSKFFGKWQENMCHVNHHHLVHICIIC
jgi:hypothetical protein